MTIYLAPRRAARGQPTVIPGSRSAGGGPDDVAVGVKQPTRGRAGRPWSPYSALLQVGFGRRCVTTGDRTLLPSDFNLTSGFLVRNCFEFPKQSWTSIPVEGGMFLCHFPSPATVAKPAQKPGRYPAPCPEEPGLSSPAG